MRLLAIDYGRKKLGVAVGDLENKLAQPYAVIDNKGAEMTIKKIEKIARKEGVGTIVVGVSESKIGKESKEFGRTLEDKIGLSVVYEDETLTTKDAQRLSVEAGIGRKKRKIKEDSYAATLILQSYFDGLG